MSGAWATEKISRVHFNRWLREYNINLDIIETMREKEKVLEEGANYPI